MRRRWLLMTLAALTSATAVNAAPPAMASEPDAPLIDAQDRPWRPAPPAHEIPLWPEGMAIARPATNNPERFGTGSGRIAGRPVTVVEDVSRPTLAIYPPKGSNTGVAVVVFPGGGYRILAIDLEGTEVCDWLTARGVTCAVLKYRVPGSGPYWSETCDCRREPAVPMALQDAQRAIGLLRQRASAWRLDPHKIGVLGFSAGGRLVADVSNHTERAYTPIDAADAQSSRPDFAIALYPGHLWQAPGLTLTPDVRVSAQTPPTFLLQAEDDPVDDVRQSLTYYLALQQAKAPVEMHLYAQGGHAFGLRRTAQPITGWPDLVETWLHTIGMLPPTR